MPRRSNKKKKNRRRKNNKKEQHRKNNLSSSAKENNPIDNEPICDDVTLQIAHNLAIIPWTERDVDEKYYVSPDSSVAAISECKTDFMWSLFPYKYRSNGKCRSFYLEICVANLFWLEGSPFSIKHPKLFAKWQQVLQGEHSAMNNDEYDEVYGSLANMNIHDMIYNLKMHAQVMLEKTDELQLYALFIDTITFLESAQFGDVIYLNAVPGCAGTYIIGFGDTDFQIIVDYYLFNKRNIDITEYLKLIPVKNLFKNGSYLYYHGFNCIPIEFCDAPIHYFADIPMNGYEFGELRFIDPSRISLDPKNVMLTNLNKEIFDIATGKKNKIEIPMCMGKYSDSDSECEWDKVEIGIEIEAGDIDFHGDYFVICDHMEFADEFCWIKREDIYKDGWDAKDLGIDSWLKRYDRAAYIKRLTFRQQLEDACGCLGADPIEIISTYIL
eukprot:317046_1